MGRLPWTSRLSDGGGVVAVTGRVSTTARGIDRGRLASWSFLEHPTSPPARTQFAKDTAYFRVFDTRYLNEKKKHGSAFSVFCFLRFWRLPPLPAQVEVRNPCQQVLLLRPHAPGLLIERWRWFRCRNWPSKALVAP